MGRNQTLEVPSSEFLKILKIQKPIRLLRHGLDCEEHEVGIAVMLQQAGNRSAPLEVAQLKLNHSLLHNLAVCLTGLHRVILLYSKQSHMCNSKATLGAEVLCREKKFRITRRPFCTLHCQSFGRNSPCLTFRCLLPHAARRSLGMIAVTPDSELDVPSLHQHL